MIAALDPANYARRFIDAGVPVVVCRPHDHHARCGTECSRELDIPAGWNTLTAHACDLSGFREGIDVLAMVSGHGIDVVDVDTKDGGSVEALPPFEHFGHHRTPSGGSHYFVKSTGFGKISPFRVNGRHVGDYAGGTPGGGGRLLVFLPGSTRARKYPDAGYHVLQPVDFERLAEAQRDDALVTVLSNVGARSTGEPGHRSAASSEVLEFLTAHSTPSDCPYGRSAVNGLIEQSRSFDPRAPDAGSPWMGRAVCQPHRRARQGRVLLGHRPTCTRGTTSGDQAGGRDRLPGTAGLGARKRERQHIVRDPRGPGGDRWHAGEGSVRGCRGRA